VATPKRSGEMGRGMGIPGGATGNQQEGYEPLQNLVDGGSDTEEGTARPNVSRCAGSRGHERDSGARVPPYGPLYCDAPNPPYQSHTLLLASLRTGDPWSPHVTSLALRWPGPVPHDLAATTPAAVRRVSGGWESSPRLDQRHHQQHDLHAGAGGA
jgi:hypothetical protein